MGCAPVKRNEQKSIEKSEKKGKSFISLNIRL